MLSLAHRRIAVLTPPAAIWPGRERIAGFAAAHAEAGLTADPTLIRPHDASGQFPFSEMRALLGRSEPPTAVICLGTHMLTGVLTALDAAGLVVPHDISLVGVGDTDLVRFGHPPLTAGANPIINSTLSTRCDGRNFFGWPCDEAFERLRLAYADAATDAARRTAAEAILRGFYEVVPYIPLGEFTRPAGYRTSLRGVLNSPMLALWNIEKR